MTQVQNQSVVAVAVRGLSKQFGSVRALDGVDLDLVRGEVHGIVGENGAGKSTLMKILAGIERPSAGQVTVQGREVQFHRVVDAMRLGIVMIHQELNLVDELSVADNIYLGRELTRFGLVDRQKSQQGAREFLSSIRSNLDPAARVGSLSVADKQMVEIAKTLSQRASVLIMDEPTASLTQRETAALIELIGHLRASGVSVIYISHILPEVLRVSDRITVMRDGRVVKTLDAFAVKRTSERELASLMVGRPMAEHFPPRKPRGDAVVLSVRNVRGISLDVHAGEIFGLAGLIGAGRTEFAEAVFGLRKSGGSVSLGGNRIVIRSPSDAVRHGIAYLSEDRKSLGLTLEMDLADNATMVSLRRYGRVLLLRKRQEQATRGHIERLRIRAGSLGAPVATLSGGNQQKVLLAKWLEIAPKVLIVDEPTRGVDIGAKEEIYRLIQQLAQQGMACIMISSEINELLGMCHRIGVMRMGKLVTILDAKVATEETIMHAAAMESAAESTAESAAESAAA